MQLSDLNDRRLAFVEEASVRLRGTQLDSLNNQRCRAAELKVRARVLLK